MTHSQERKDSAAGASNYNLHGLALHLICRSVKIGVRRIKDLI